MPLIVTSSRLCTRAGTHPHLDAYCVLYCFCVFVLLYCMKCEKERYVLLVHVFIANETIIIEYKGSI